MRLTVYQLEHSPYCIPITRSLGALGLPFVTRNKERKFGPGCEERWELERPALQTEAERLLSPFDLALAHRPFLFDDQPIFSDFALFGVLGNLTYREYNSLPASLTKLAGWFERMRTFQYEPSAEN